MDRPLPRGEAGRRPAPERQVMGRLQMALPELPVGLGGVPRLGDIPPTRTDWEE